MKLFKNWTDFEKILLFLSIIGVGFIGIIFKSDVITTICSIIGIITALLLAKGKILGQFFGILIVILYSYVSYQNQYYGEMLIYIFIMLPLYIYGIITWIKNQNKETKTVEHSSISKKEWSIISFISIILFISLYFVLRCFNTKELILSTLSIIGSLYAVYLVARRSKYGFLFYVFDDVILFIMWLIPIINGKNFLVLPMIFNPTINLINDLYGWINWNKLERAKDKS